VQTAYGGVFIQEKGPPNGIPVGLGHTPQIEDPDQFNNALLKALGRL
jgi:pimeloyl-ACP methyl ester carboxylesterase